MRSEVSAFMDDELDEDSTGRLLDSLGRDASLRVAWDEYCLIGDVMRRANVTSLGVTGAVMSRLDAEPTVLAPPPARARRASQRPLWAVAASVLGVGVVAWMALRGAPTETSVAKSEPATAVASRQVAAVGPQASHQERGVVLAGAGGPPPSGSVMPYLIVHQSYGSVGGMQGVAQYVRAVSETRQDAAR